MMGMVLVFRISVSSNESCVPRDYSHLSKSHEEFKDDVKRILKKLPVDELEIRTLEDGSIWKSYIDGNTIQNYLDKKLIELGYFLMDDITEIKIDPFPFKRDDMFPDDLFTEDVKNEIMKHNGEVDDLIDKFITSQKKKWKMNIL
jgi:hypothetical protein